MGISSTARNLHRAQAFSCQSTLHFVPRGSRRRAPTAYSGFPSPTLSAGLRRLAQTNQARGQTDTVSDCSLVSRVDSVGPPALSGRRPGLASLGMPTDNGWEEGAGIKVRRNEKTSEIDTTDQGAGTRE